MAIDIKELFVTDLDPNSGAWWSKDKVDKINYNFYLLSNGGMPGPQGTQGADGEFGRRGSAGIAGYQGSQGYQGTQGNESLGDWDYFPEAIGLPGYLYPKKNPVGETQAAPVALRIGYLSTEGTLYGFGANPQSPIQLVKTKDSSWVNLRVEDNGQINGYNFSFKSSSGLPRFEISPDIVSDKSTIICTAKSTVFKNGTSSSLLNDSIVITDSLITVNIPPTKITTLLFNLSNEGINTNKFTKSEFEFRFKTGAGANKILTSTNSQGNLQWKNVKDVFVTFPVGSIISIRQSEFNSTHFWLNGSVNVVSGSPLNNIYGRGKVGTDYEGWYLCNGQTWETVSGANQYLTPDLNNFSYNIAANGDAQDDAILLESENILVGGYDMRIQAVPDGDGIYYINYTSSFLNNNQSPGNSLIFLGTSVSYNASRMIHLVYLENPNLKWSTTFTPPIETTGILLTAPQSSAELVCSAPVENNYSWNAPFGASWNTFTPLSSYSLFNYSTTDLAQAGWYGNLSGYPIYWDGDSFTQRGQTCEYGSLRTFVFQYAIDGLNGTISEVSNLTQISCVIDTVLFIDATTIEIAPGGDGIDIGWFRDLSTGVRRFWDGSQFLGVSFTTDYVVRVTLEPGLDNGFGYNNPQYGYLPAPSEPGGTECTNIVEQHITYVAGNSQYLNEILQARLTALINYGSPLYVPLDWSDTSAAGYDTYDEFGDVATTPPLINIKDQPVPDDTSYVYNKMRIFDINNSQRYARISNISGIPFGNPGNNSPINCS